MRLVTVANKSGGYFEFLVASCRRFGAELEVLGWGKPWRGFNLKNIMMNHYLKDIPDHEIICVIDAHDVILLRPLWELEAAFVKFTEENGRKIVVGIDRNTNMFHAAYCSIQYGSCNGEFLNAGTYIGYAGDIRGMVQYALEINHMEHADDQKLLTMYCDKHPEKIYIDDGMFFLTSGACFGKKMPIHEFIMSPDGIEYKGHRPFFIHGPCKTDMYEVIKGLGYNINETLGKQIHYENVKDRINVYMHNVYMLISAIVLFAFLRYVYK